jgi:hypothetical protein
MGNSFRSCGSFTTTLKRTEKLRNCYVSLLYVEPNCASKETRERTNILLFECRIGHFAWRPTYVLLLPATQIFHKSIVVQHSVFLFCWQWYVADQHTHRTHCCVCTTTMVPRTRHNVTLYRVIPSVLDPRKCKYLKDYSLFNLIFCKYILYF